MKLGTVVVCGLILLCAATAVTLPEKKDTRLEDAQRSLEVYKNKLMYSEAIREYKNIINLTPYENSYELVIELRDYCEETGEQEAYIEACRMAVKRDPSDYVSAEAVLKYLDEKGKSELYSYAHELMNAENVSPEAYQHYSDFYDTIKGRYSLSKLAVESIGEWVGDSYAMGVYDSDNDCVVGTDGSFLIQGKYGRIDSYSPEGGYIAVTDNDQKVYVDINSRRKLVPYDYQSDQLVYYNYLGRIESGMANFCYDQNQWGYLTSSMSVKYGGLDAATPVSEGLFAFKSEGKWEVYYHGSSKDVFMYSCDDLYMEGDVFASRCIADYNAKTKTYYIYAKENGSGWSLVKLVADFSEKDIATSSEKLGSQTFDEVSVFGSGCGAVKTGGKWKFIDQTGAIIEKMGEYDGAKSMRCGLCPVKTDVGLWGYIDGNGKLVIDAVFEEANTLSSAGTAAVRSSDGWHLLRLNEYK